MEKERIWTFIMYPDSLPENYLEILQETGLEIAISPLHDRDINVDETQKKPHYHVVLFFRGPTTYNRVEKITKMLNATIPKRVMSAVGIIRYLTHKDNPEKAQYNEEDIRTLNGLDLKDIVGITQTQKEILKREIIKLIREYNIEEYCDLYDYCLVNKLKEFMEIISQNTIFFKAYLDSKRHKKKETLEELKNLLQKKN